MGAGLESSNAGSWSDLHHERRKYWRLNIVGEEHFPVVIEDQGVTQLAHVVNASERAFRVRLCTEDPCLWAIGRIVRVSGGQRGMSFVIDCTIHHRDTQNLVLRIIREQSTGASAVGWERIIRLLKAETLARPGRIRLAFQQARSNPEDTQPHAA